MTPTTSTRSSPWEVFRVFLRLGLTSFGGPIAHLGYFRTECVARLGWLSERAYADLVALCQFLPGPASSQAGIGLAHAALAGGAGLRPAGRGAGGVVAREAIDPARNYVDYRSA